MASIRIGKMVIVDIVQHRIEGPHYAQSLYLTNS